jgi:hypothetical protein
MMPTVSAATVSAQHKTSEEDGANDEDHAGDDRHPGGGLVDPVGPTLVRWQGWDGCGCRFLLKCFSHNAIVADPV